MRNKNEKIVKYIVCNHRQTDICHWMVKMWSFWKTKKEIGRIPLHNLQAIVTFGYTGASPALMGACAQRNISLSFMSGNGRFLARVTGEVKGNVTLRKQQYRISDNKDESVHIARNFILGKVHNSRWILERAVRDHSIRLDTENIKK